MNESLVRVYLRKRFGSTLAFISFSLLAAFTPLSFALAVTDTVAPTVALTAPANSATVSGTVSITANASDASIPSLDCVVTLFGIQYDITTLTSTHSGGNIFACGTDMTSSYQSQHGTNVNRMSSFTIPTAGVTKVEFYVDSVLKSTDTTLPFSYAWDSTTAGNGSHTLKTTAYDAANNNSSNSVTVTVNNTTSTTTSTTTLPYFTPAELAPFDGTSSSLPIYIGLNGKVYDVTAGSSFYVPGGSYHFLAGRDSSVELNQFGANLITDKYPVVGLLILPPAVTITNPLNNASIFGTVNISATASSSLSIARVEFYIDGAFTLTDASDPFGFAWNTTLISNGSHTLMAKAFDSANKSGMSSTTVVFANNTVGGQSSTTATSTPHFNKELRKHLLSIWKEWLNHRKEGKDNNGKKDDDKDEHRINASVSSSSPSLGNHESESGKGSRNGQGNERKDD